MGNRANLHEAVRQAVDPMALMQRVAEEATSLIAGAEGVLIGLAHDATLTFVCATGFLRDRLGATAPVEGSLAGLAVRTGMTLRSDDIDSDPRVLVTVARAYGIGSTVSVPLRRRGEAVGVLSVNSSHRNAFGDADVTTLTQLADFVSVAVAAAADLTEVTNALLPPPQHRSAFSDQDLGAKERFVTNVLSPGALGSIESRQRIERMIEQKRLTHHLQPIFDLWTGELFSFEALARFRAKPNRPPDQWFAEAYAVGLGLELEAASLREALALVSVLPEGIGLSVNAGPEAMASDEVRTLLAASDPSTIVLELTEQIPVEDYPRLCGSIDRLRHTGARLAIDDTGAGFASFAHILKLKPDLIKLDRALTTGIDSDPVRRALGAALVTFAAHTGAEIIAEGIETAAELAVLGDLGVRYGQGYFLGRPAPLGSVCWEPAHEVSSRAGRLGEALDAREFLAGR